MIMELNNVQKILLLQYLIKTEQLRPLNIKNLNGKDGCGILKEIKLSQLNHLKD